MSKQGRHSISSNLYSLLYSVKQYQNRTIPLSGLLMMMNINEEELQKLKRPNLITQQTTENKKNDQ